MTSLPRLTFLFLFAFSFTSCERADEPALRAINLVLVPHLGEDTLDESIQRAQGLVEKSTSLIRDLERLGWAYVAKARMSRDEGFYLLAESCADAMVEAAGQEHRAIPVESLLLRGHVSANLHRFSEAEILARELVARRGLPYDFLLLGDALMEQGKFDGAIEAYQKGVELRPGMQSYARVGWMRWLIGDLTGAIEATELAANASTPVDREAWAWIRTRLGHFLFLSGDRERAAREVAMVRETMPDYPPALLLTGRLALADGSPGKAVEVLRRAAELEPLPEILWTLAEALHEAGELEAANLVEQSLARDGESGDPRTYALYLSTHGKDPETALRLAEAEILNRADPHTRDALAWALYANGRISEAQVEIDRALVEETIDARFFLHAATIASAAGAMDEATDWLKIARDYRHTLLPSELRRLDALSENLPTTSPLAVDSTNP